MQILATAQILSYYQIRGQTEETNLPKFVAANRKICFSKKFQQRPLGKDKR